MKYHEIKPKPQHEDYWWVKRLTDNELDVGRIIKLTPNDVYEENQTVVFLPGENAPYEKDELDFVCKIERPVNGLPQSQSSDG